MMTGKRAFSRVVAALTLGFSAPASGGDVRISVEELPSHDEWRVTYELPEPVRGMFFARNRNAFRSTSWVLEGDPSLHWVREGDYEAVVSDSGRIDRVVLRFSSNFEDLPKDYKLNLPFTDGGRLLYTGHLAAQPYTCTSDCSEVFDATPPVPIVWTFRTDGGRTIRRLSASSPGRLRWKQGYAADGNLVGDAYVYFGTVKPVAAARITVVQDPGLPAWLSELTAEFMPRLFDYYAQRTGIELDFVPVVYASFVPSAMNGTVLKGGTLDGLVQLEATGDAWTTETSGLRTHWIWFLAHESFHFWDGQMHHTRHGRWEEWLSEGAANWFAAQALLDLELIATAEYESRMDEAAGRCRTSLGGRPLVTTNGEPYGVEYDCGQVILEAMHRRMQTQKGDLGALFGRVFRRDPSRKYSTFDLLDEYQTVMDSPDSTMWLSRILFGGVPESEFFESLVR
jgi:hypothetical protein